MSASAHISVTVVVEVAHRPRAEEAESATHGHVVVVQVGVRLVRPAHLEKHGERA